MKLPAARIEAFVSRPDPTVATVLLYGPDAGLVADRGRRLARGVVEDLNDPFRVSELTADDLREQPGRLVEEAQALCLMGGRRLVRVRDASDAASAAVRQLLALPAQEGFVLLEAGDLGGGSSLRRAVEAAPKAAALPCYREEGGNLAGSIRDILAEHGLRAEPDALGFLAANLGGDRALTRGELDKLALYLADAPERKVTLEDAAAVVGDSSALGLDDVAHAAAAGELARLDRLLDRLLAEGEAPVRILRVASAFFLRLLRLRADMAAGATAEAAVKAAKPPIHFRAEPAFLAALRLWPAEALTEALARLQGAEIGCKSTGLPDALVCRSALAELARLGRHQQQRRR